MHIALVTDGIWPYVLGGMQKHSYYLCKYLAQNKIKVDLYHFNQSHYDIKAMDYFTEEEKTYIRSIIVDLPKTHLFPGHYIYESYQYSKNVYQAIKGHLNSYDFIYSKGFAAWYLIEQKHAHKIKCAPIGVKFHGYEMFQKPPSFKSSIQNALFLRYPVKKISLQADVVFSYGAKINDIILSLGVNPANMIEIPSGVEENFVSKDFMPSNEKIKVIYLGRYERRKGIEELNQAIEKFTQHKKSSRLEFHFVGPIPEDKRIIIESVVYHGEVRDKTLLQNILRSADVLVCASWSEGMPNVILEGMASGLAIIATNVGASGILVDHNNGWMIEHPEVDKLVDIFKYLQQMPLRELDQKKAASLAKMHESFTWEKLIHRLIAAIKNTLETKH